MVSKNEIRKKERIRQFAFVKLFRSFVQSWLIEFQMRNGNVNFSPFLFCSHLPHFTRISTGPHPWSWQLPEKGAKFVPPTILLTCDNDQSPWRLWSWSALNFYNIIHIISRAFVCDIWPTLIMNFRVNEIILMKKKPNFSVCVLYCVSNLSRNAFLICSVDFLFDISSNGK